VTEIQISGHDYRWRMPTRTGDVSLYRQTGSEQAELWLPANRRIRLVLNSDDFIYRFEIPALGVREMAVPGVPMMAELHTPDAGRYELTGDGMELKGDQMCGFRHQSLKGRVRIAAPAEYRAWLEAQGRLTAGTGSATGRGS
jgi:heme/copper-type cytochrome/quinol oxidase subunit 2